MDEDKLHQLDIKIIDQVYSSENNYELNLITFFTCLYNIEI